VSAGAPILLVEDNPDDRELTIMSLRESNIANPIDVARDGQEALSYFADLARPLPAVVLLDLQLPRISGLDVLRRLRQGERTRVVPVVMLSSSNEESDRMRSYDLGANAYVCKPVEFGGFAEAVKTLGLFWLVINAPPPPPPIGEPGP
jgi:two-component system response regulator